MQTVPSLNITYTEEKGASHVAGTVGGAFSKSMHNFLS